MKINATFHVYSCFHNFNVLVGMKPFTFIGTKMKIRHNRSSVTVRVAHTSSCSAKFLRIQDMKCT